MHNTIDHILRNELNLSIIDWCILQSIYNLSGDKAKYKGWCNASKSYFAPLASERTIVSRYKKLEKDGWLEFSCNRNLKRTTQKYKDLVILKKGVKKLHGEEIAPVQELHLKGEEIAHLGVQELHLRGEEIAPNNNRDNNKDNKRDSFSLKKEEKLKSENQKLKEELQALKSKVAEKEEKVALKKEKSAHVFPDLSPSKSYFSEDKRKDKNLPFDSVSAFQTAMALDFEECRQYCLNAFQISIDAEFFKSAAETFGSKAVGNYSNYMGITEFPKLKSKFLSWLNSHYKYQAKGEYIKNNYSNSKSDDDSLMMGLISE